MTSANRQLLSATIPSIFFLIIIWTVYLLSFYDVIDVRDWAVLPRDWSQIQGIIFMPLMHENLDHILSNSVPLFFTCTLLFYFYKPIAWRVLGIIWIFSGFWVWMAARTNYHIGASAVIYGLVFFLFISGVIRKDRKLLIVALIVVFLYGSLVWGILPYNPTMSWEGHLYGSIAGILCAWFLRKEGPAVEQSLFSERDSDYINYHEVEKRISAALQPPPANQNNPSFRQINSVTANIVDVLNGKIFFGIIHVAQGKISSVIKLSDELNPQASFILPGFIDAHIHIESSMLTPYEFSRIALAHGTVATISDPHEIANVCGLAGVRYMLENAKQSPLNFCFGAPSCVPATPFETAGATLSASDIEILLRDDGLKYLAEMMNYPGVLHNDALVMDKINVTKKYGRKIDGHAPGLMGDDAIKYIQAGITTDHECFTEEEALHKLKNGMKILIREGSAAKNFDALIPLAHLHYHEMMLCSDDKHPDDLQHGHINLLVARAVKYGVDVMKVLRMACINPILHYGLEAGMLQPGQSADFIEVDNLRDFHVQKTFIAGALVAANGNPFLTYKKFEPINHFNCHRISARDLRTEDRGLRHCIVALDGQLITQSEMVQCKTVNGYSVSDTENDILKIVVINRYHESPPAISFIKNMGFKHGAIASTVAHDSHNIIACGADDESMAAAINAIVDSKGGLSYADSDTVQVLPLPIAGLISEQPFEEVGKRYSALDALAKQAGSKLRSPYMTLSFMALPVIPSLKLTDHGLFNVDTFSFVKE